MREKIENLTMNRNWIWNGRMYIDIFTWNTAIEVVISELEKIGHSTDSDVEQIRKLKK